MARIRASLQSMPTYPVVCAEESRIRDALRRSDPSRRISAPPSCTVSQPICRHPAWRPRSEQLSEPTGAGQSSVQRGRSMCDMRQRFCRFCLESRGMSLSRGLSNVLAGLVPQTATLSGILAAGQDVSDQPIPTEQTIGGSISSSGRQVGGRELPSRTAKTRLDQGPAPADPVAVAAVYQFIRAAGEAALGCVLTR